MYECENDDKPQIDMQLTPYECAMPNDSKLCNVHVESAEIEKRSILDFDSMSEELQADYLDGYDGVQVQIHQVSQFDDSSAVSATYLGKPDRTRKDVTKA